MEKQTNNEITETISLIYNLSIIANVLNVVNINKVVFVTEDGIDLSIDTENLVALAVEGTVSSLMKVVNQLEKTLK